MSEDRLRGGVNRRQVFSCTDCDQFEFGKKYSGAVGTRGESMYNQIGFDSCPVCGGRINRSDTNQEGHR